MATDAETALARQWIPTSEPPPIADEESRYSKDVLVLFSGGSMRVGFFAHEGGQWIFFDDDAPWDESATYWMPLPDPPGEKASRALNDPTPGVEAGRLKGGGR